MGIRIYSCYWSSNSTISYFVDFINRLQFSIWSTATPIIVAGDFNFYSPEWGSPDENAGSTILADAMSALNLYVCNNGQPTFMRGASMTHIFTFVSESLARNVNS